MMHYFSKQLGKWGIRDGKSKDIAAVKVTITNPSGDVKDIQSQELKTQKDNFWFRTDHTHEHGDACGHDHDHDHDHEHEEVLLTLTDENGNDVEMVLVETFDVEKQVYALLLERNNPEADGIILRMEEEDEEMVLYNIEDEEEWTRVEAAYNELVASQE
ncbi:hypothetical protein G195_008910 [Phytophthora kernoviae 00238/432]|uniref:DUF1292 domain-containing protein n=1 Tax=Phytophthora kernoviae 00238/432 TaxID=1284355 RepID=A0A8J4W8T9_9STRA|nr:hypothetical protein G195_008910 [Phytophthora kernoviae 00238/432]